MGNQFDVYFQTLRGKRIAVLGLGVSNRPLVRLLLSYGCDVTGCDRTERSGLDEEVLALEQAGCKLSVGEHYLDDVEADVVFRTPGMHPGNPAIEKMRTAGAQITSEMEVFFQLCPCTILAVTGSDGKTTTTTLISEMLKAEGKTVWLGGNIGTPLLPRTPEMKPEDYAVVELSSFQLMDMTHSPHVAVITNLSPNHLDVHRDMEEYVEAKMNIFRFQTAADRLVLNGDNALTSVLCGAGRTVYFSRKNVVDGAYTADNTIYKNGVKVLDVRDILLPGVHNIENYMAAILAVEGLVSDDTIRRVASSFGGVEHRIELIRLHNGVRYYNDSIASSPSRTIAGLRSFEEKVILIAGGYDKKIPFDVLGPEICKHVKKLYLNGATAGKIRESVEKCSDYSQSGLQILDCGDFETAVRCACRDAREGDVVLMSPACAAFDQFKNFMVRGDAFRKLIMEL